MCDKAYYWSRRRCLNGAQTAEPNAREGFPTSIFLSHGYGLLFFAYEGDIGGRRICARAFLKPAIELDSLDGDARKAVGPICPTEDSNRLILLDWGISFLGTKPKLGC
jgi:hypothetical protein